METVLITGASSGIGADAAVLFGEHGYEVVLCGRSSAKLETVAAKISGLKHVLPGDLTDKSYRDNIVRYLSSNKIQGRFTTLVNNAGIYTQHRSSLEIEEKHYRDQFEVNFLAPVLLATELFTLLKKNTPSSVINISSTLGLRPIPGTNHYSAQKAALINWTECLAPEWAKHGIRVNCICPGLIETPIHNANFSDPKVRSQMDAIQPIGRVGKPRDISEAILFLASEKSAWTTGSVFSVDGGVRLI